VLRTCTRKCQTWRQKLFLNNRQQEGSRRQDMHKVRSMQLVAAAAW
jgi:hypothetical protein